MHTRACDKGSFLLFEVLLGELSSIWYYIVSNQSRNKGTDMGLVLVQHRHYECGLWNLQLIIQLLIRSFFSNALRFSSWLLGLFIAFFHLLLTCFTIFTWNRRSLNKSSATSTNFTLVFPKREINKNNTTKLINYHKNCQC